MGVFVLFFVVGVFFSFNLLIANPTVGGYFFLVLPRFVCISLATFSQSVVDVVLHLWVANGRVEKGKGWV